MSKRVITINRMLGSNGRLIGRALADELGFAFYDKELIDIAAKKKKISPMTCLKRWMKKGAANGVFLLTMNCSWTVNFILFP